MTSRIEPDKVIATIVFGIPFVLYPLLVISLYHHTTQISRALFI